MSNWTLAALAVLFGLSLFALADFCLSQVGWLGLVNDPLLRTRHPVYHHSLTPNLCTKDDWGPVRHYVCTNSLGFKDAVIREVAKTSEKPRLLLIGDSFTEGVGMNWEQSFAGLFANGHPGFEVLNAGVRSYAPTVYYVKVRDLLEQGYRFDHVVVFVDISDIQDESWYELDDQGRVYKTSQEAASAWQVGFERFCETNFKALVDISDLIDDLIDGNPLKPDIFTAPRGAWTFTDWDRLAPAYAPLGVGKSIEHAKASMDRLHDLLKANGIKLSVGVYPWPGQMKFDGADSMQVRLWRDWCKGKCANFMDGFAPFFAWKGEHPDSWYRDLYIDGDVHFSADGNRLMARMLDGYSWP